MCEVPIWITFPMVDFTNEKLKEESGTVDSNMKPNAMPMHHHKENMHHMCKKYMNQKVHLQTVDGNAMVVIIDHVDAENVYVTEMNDMMNMSGMPGGMPGYPGMPGGMPGYPGMPGDQGMPQAPEMQDSMPGMQRNEDDERVWGHGFGGIRRWILPLTALAVISAFY
jgi:hypothetical protein